VIRRNMLRSASVSLPIGSLTLERCTYKFLGRLTLVRVSVSHELTVSTECFAIVVLGHQKHTPFNCAKRRSDNPRRCPKIMSPIYSRRLFFTWFITEAAVIAVLTVVCSRGVVVIISHLRHRFTKIATMITWYQINL
jgi:hypothetical protein